MTEFSLLLKRIADTPMEELKDDCIFYDDKGNPTLQYKQPEGCIRVQIDAVGDKCMHIDSPDLENALITVQGNSEDNEVAVVAPEEILEIAGKAVGRCMDLLVYFIERLEDK